MPTCCIYPATWNLSDSPKQKKVALEIWTPIWVGSATSHHYQIQFRVNIKLWKWGPFVLHKILLNNVHHFHCLVVSWLHVIVRNLRNFYNLKNCFTHLNTLSVMRGVPDPVSPVTQILTYEHWLFTSTGQIFFK